MRSSNGPVLSNEPRPPATYGVWAKTEGMAPPLGGDPIFWVVHSGSHKVIDARNVDRSPECLSLRYGLRPGGEACRAPQYQEVLRGPEFPNPGFLRLGNNDKSHGLLPYSCGCSEMKRALRNAPEYVYES